jgi:shikimate kinase
MMTDVAISKVVAGWAGPEIVAALRGRSVVLVGMMGAGKSSVGRRLAARLAVPFTDADSEIEKAANMGIPEIFANHGEAYFRSGEARVIARLLDHGPQVLATGGGAFMNPETREVIRAKGLSVWLKADLDVLLKRIKRRSSDERPMLKGGDLSERVEGLVAERYPVYAEAEVTIYSRDVPHERIVDDIVESLSQRLGLVEDRRLDGEP